jgi:hypothetical protein
MKYSVATVATLAAGVLAAAPEFTNIEFDVEEGKKFEITFNGCDEGCTIVLQNGPSSNLKSVETLTSKLRSSQPPLCFCVFSSNSATAEATDGSFIWTPEDLPSDTYAFKIFPTGDETDFNYSKQFEYEGTGSPSSTAASSPASTKATSSSAESTSAESTSADTTMTTSSSAETSSAASTTSESSKFPCH